MSISIRRRPGSTETESSSSSSSYTLHNNLHNFNGRSPLPHHREQTSGSSRSLGYGGGGAGFAASHDTSSSSSMLLTRKGRMSFDFCLGLGFVLLIFPWFPYSLLSTYYKTLSLRNDYEALQGAHKNLVTELKSSVDTRRTVTEQIKAAEELNKNLLLALKDYGDNIDPDNNVYAMAEQVEEAYVARIDDLESVLSLWSERRLRDQYGETKEKRLRFTVTLLFSSESVGGDSNGQQNQNSSFVMETARLDKMPYSIDFFQQMVQEQLCDGLVMTIQNDPGVELIQAGQQQQQMDIDDGTTNATAASTTTTSSTMISSGATTTNTSSSSQTLLFTERSLENPIEKYAVSFALQGQQQGPGFVVHMHQQNKESSSSSSSPAFQESAYGMESAFAKVVEGQQLLDGIMDDDSNSRIVTIQSIRLVGA